MPEQQGLDTIQLLPLSEPTTMVTKPRTKKSKSPKNKSSTTAPVPEERRQKMELIANFSVAQKCSETVKPKGRSFLSRLFCKRENNSKKDCNSEVVDLCVPVEGMKKQMVIQIDCKTGKNNTTNINLRLKPLKSDNSMENVINTKADSRLKTIISTLLSRGKDEDGQMLLQTENNTSQEVLSESSTTFTSGFLGTSSYFTANGTTVRHNQDLIQIQKQARQRTTTM